MPRTIKLARRSTIVAVMVVEVVRNTQKSVTGMSSLALDSHYKDPVSAVAHGHNGISSLLWK